MYSFATYYYSEIRIAESPHRWGKKKEKNDIDISNEFVLG